MNGKLLELVEKLREAGLRTNHQAACAYHRNRGKCDCILRHENADVDEAAAALRAEIDAQLGAIDPRTRMKLMTAYNKQGYTEFHAFPDAGGGYTLLVNPTTMYVVRIYDSGRVFMRTTGDYVEVKETPE
jgi:hypothetical protein